LLKIDKAIQDVDDQREYFREYSDHEHITPLEQRCQIINAQSFEDAARQSGNEADLPLAILTQPGLFSRDSADFTFIQPNFCNEEGVRLAQEELRSALRNYHRAFLDLSRMRKNYEDNNDLFGQALNSFLSTSKKADRVAEGGLGKIQLLYNHIKNSVETGIYQFIIRLTQNAYNIIRLQRIAIGRRMGWGYLLNNPNAHFIVIVRHVSFLYGISNSKSLIEIPESWIPFSYRLRSTTTLRPLLKRSAISKPSLQVSNNATSYYFKKYLSPVSEDCVTTVNSLGEFTSVLTEGKNKTFQILALTEINVVLNKKIAEAKSIFYMWLLTSKGWFTSYYYQEKLNVIEQLFDNVLQKMANPKFNKIDLKIKLLDNLRTTLIHAMDSNLKWYYYPDGVIHSIHQTLNTIFRDIETAVKH